MYKEVVGFIKDTFNVADDFIPLHEPRFLGNEKKYVVDTIDSTFVSSVGAYVDKFELMMSSISGTNKSIAVVNGTSALQVALRLAGVNAGDEVITQALTFIATVNAIIYNGAVPIFIDVDKDTMGLSPNAVEAFLEEFGEMRDGISYNKKTNKKIAACMPMHTFGFPVHLNELLKVCNKWNIPLVEDAAEAIGSEYHSKIERDLLSLINSSPRNLDYLSSLANFYQNIGDINNEIKFRKKIVGLDPWNAQNLLSLGLAYKSTSQTIEMQNTRNLILEFAADEHIG